MSVREYVIRQNRRQGGVTLSLRSHWGNIPYDDVDAARRAAAADSGGNAMTIERQGC